MRLRWISLPVVLALSTPGVAFAQACCSGGNAVTPARLALPEAALVGARLHASLVTGSFDPHATYTKMAPGGAELDSDEDLFGAVRVLKHGQLAALVPVVETYRHARSAGGEVGGGLGDVNLGARYDFTDAGCAGAIPGIAALTGFTLPTGRAVEDATLPLASDTTGVGAPQASIGLAVEQIVDRTTIGATASVAYRFPRTARGVRTALAPEMTALFSVAERIGEEAAIAGYIAVAAEGDATLAGVSEPDSSRRTPTLGLSGVLPLAHLLRLQGALEWLPPLTPLGKNTNATVGLGLALIRSFT